MRKTATLFCLVLFLIPMAAPAQNGVKDFFTQVDVFMKKYVRDGRFDYKSLKENEEQQELERLRIAAKRVYLPNMASNWEKAYWINAYNVSVISLLNTHYPVASPRDIEGFFDHISLFLAQKRVTLDQIENEYLRKKFKDPRIHFALVCGAKGCPPLADFAFRGDIIDQQLDARARAALNDNNFIRVDKEAKKVYVSEIFKWFKDDFTAGGKSVLQFINQYRDEKIPEDFSVDYYPYDWSLNEYTEKD